MVDVDETRKTNVDKTYRNNYAYNGESCIIFFISTSAMKLTAIIKRLFSKIFEVDKKHFK